MLNRRFGKRRRRQQKALPEGWFNVYMNSVDFNILNWTFNILMTQLFGTALEF